MISSLHSFPSSSVGVGGRTKTIGNSIVAPPAAAAATAFLAAAEEARIVIELQELKAGEIGAIKLGEEKVDDVGVKGSPSKVDVVDGVGEVGVGDRSAKVVVSRGEKMAAESREERDA